MNKGIPIGVNSYRELKENDYYVVDKSMMIQDFLKRKTKVTLITRPRRFGKTINMSMMAAFFDITKDSKKIFEDTAIMKTEYAGEINSYPTIFLSFADAKGKIDNITRQIQDQIAKLYAKYEFVFQNIGVFEKPRYERIVNAFYEDNIEGFDKLDNAIAYLMMKLHQYYGKRVMLFIDEYDTPFIEAHIQGSYDEIRSSLASMLHSSLKTSDDLQYAMLTGIQRVAKENIFSDLNNLIVCTVNDPRYAQYFGFTEEEVKDALEYYEMDFSEDVKSMYDGYNMGGIDIYNPWSIVNYIDLKELIPYWVNTSANKMIRSAMQNNNETFYKEYEKLIQTGKIETLVNFETSFYELRENSSLWGLFVNAGYLTIDKIVDYRKKKYVLRIPNDEVRMEFQSLTANYLHVQESNMENIMDSLVHQDWDIFLDEYRSILLQSVSSHDLLSENSYHTLLLGMCLWLKDAYEVTSNRENGEGRYDILLKSKTNDHPSILIELKYTKDAACDVKKLAQQGLSQIQEKQYQSGITNCIGLSLAHYHKQVEMAVAMNP